MSSARRMPIGVLVSGNGSNLQALIDEQEAGRLPVEIRAVVCNKPGVYALERAAKHHLPALVLPNRQYATREEHEGAICRALEAQQVQLVVLAGYMRLLTPFFVRRYKNRIINLHPALLPAFPGTDSIRRAFEGGVKVTGVTVHFVDEGEDTGPIILQQALPIEGADTVETLEAKVHALEHRLLPQAVRLFAEGKLRLEGRRVLISS